jgi:hypothetical protein
VQEEEKAVLRDTAHRAEREAQLLAQLQRSEEEKAALRDSVRRAELEVQLQGQAAMQAALQRTQELNLTLQQSSTALAAAGGSLRGDTALQQQLQRSQAESAALRRELGGIDPAFFEDVEDMKYK